MNVTSESKLDEARMRVVADHLPTPVFYCDRALVYRYVNPAGARWHSRPATEIVGHHITEIMGADQVALLQERHVAALAGETLKFEKTLDFADGDTRRVQSEYVPDTDETGAVVGFFAILTDITERYEAERVRVEAAQQLQMISDAVPAQICFLDRDRRYIWVNQTTADWFATDVDKIVGRTTEQNYGAEFARKTQSHVDRVLAGERVEYETRYTFPDGKERDVDVSCIPNIHDDGQIDGYVLIAHDVTDYKRTEEELRLLATTDPLTGVYNRRRFIELCEEELVRAKRYGRPVSVIMCDLDHFKRINDTYGHAGGDAVITAFAAMARGTLRDGIDAVGRMGGEEFALLLPESGIAVARTVADRLRRLCAETDIDVDGAAARVTCSFGVAELDNAADDIDAMLKRADLALYSAKSAGRNRVGISEDDEAEAEVEVEVEVEAEAEAIPRATAD